jgi:hypothetical protein
VKREFGFDIFVVMPDSEQKRDWVTLFSQVNVKWRRQFGWPADAKKGIMRVAL